MKYYSNDIYPIALVLSYESDSINKEYTDWDGNDITVKPTAQATTLPLTRRAQYYAMAVGIVFNSNITPKLAAHEGFHAAYFMLEVGVKIPLSDTSNEAWAYLIGWIAECIDDFKNTVQK